MYSVFGPADGLPGDSQTNQITPNSPPRKKTPPATQLHAFTRNFDVVRIWCFIFAFVVSALACAPCSDASTCTREHEEHEITVADASHDHSTDEADFCSPFCSCTCCSMQISQPSYFSFSAFNPSYHDLNVGLFQHRFQSINLSIWQPPRLG